MPLTTCVICIHLYTAKKTNLFRLDENRIEQCFTAHIVQCCQQYCSALLHLIQAQQYCSTLLTTMNNVGSKTLFNPVFINPEQVDNFLPLTPYTPKNYHLFKVVENMMQQCCAAYIVHSCQQYCSALLSLDQLAVRCNLAEQYC